jgi:uncharacterized damage-inducible protein DinB
VNVSAQFLGESRRLLAEDHMPRIRRAVAELPAEDLWWRPNDASNSPGNLMLHLAGNLRQWIVSGVGGAPDERRRQEEFDRRSGTTAEVLGVLQSAVDAAVAVLDGLDPDRLLDSIAVQGRETTRLAAIYHAVEHFSMHAGQILWIAKARTGRDLGLYLRGADGHPYPTWTP